MLDFIVTTPTFKCYTLTHQNHCISVVYMHNWHYLVWSHSSTGDHLSSLPSLYEIKIFGNKYCCTWDHKPPCVETKIFVEIFDDFDGFESNILVLRQRNC